MSDQNIVVVGETFKDYRGSLRFFNFFDMQEVVRFYEIAPANIEQIRGWQAHRIEKKWFYCLKGTFVINTIKLDNFEEPSKQLKPERFVLKSTVPKILCVAKGHATAIKALTKGSRLQVFSNSSLQESKDDDFRYPIGQWSANWKI